MKCICARALFAGALILAVQACDEGVTLPTATATDVPIRNADAAQDTARPVPDVGTPDTADEEVGEPDVGPETDDDADAGAGGGDASDGEVALDAETDSADDADDDSTDDATDVAAVDAALDTPVPENCGDGVVDRDEECDDGNDDDSDECTNICTVPRCGDGRLNSTFGEERFTDPVVENPFGQSGRVCDDGATCPPGVECVLEDDDDAPEHGICQALGYEYAVDVVWSASTSTTRVSPVVFVHDWRCWDYYCFESEYGGEGGTCAEFEILAEVGCAGIVGEECDAGADNADEADACRTDCTLPRCGDGIIDTDEECDDGNRIDDDECSNECREAFCGDGIVQAGAGEECDDGNDDDDDSCSNECESDVPPCVDFDIGSATGSAVLTGSTTGRPSVVSASCGGGSPEVTVGWVAPRSGSFTFDLGGSSYDTLIHVHDGTGGSCPGAELACNDDSIGLQSRVTVSVTAGQILIIYVDGFSSSSSGSFVLNISG